MSIKKIEVRFYNDPALIESQSGIPEIFEINQGPPGATGPQGPAGPNSVTSATTSDGTAELLVSNIISGQGVGSPARIIGVNQNENSIIGGYFESYVAEAVLGVSRDSVGVVGTSENDVGVRASSQQGDYSAQFENDFTAQSAIERVRGWFVWFYNAFTGRLKTADITANRDWTLPDRTGNIALTEDYTAGTAAIDVLNATVQGTLTANHIHGNIAGSVYAHVRAGENLAKGDPVYVSGSHGSGASLIAIVSKADASNAAKMPAVGVMDAAVSANANGHMVITGTISDIDTNAYAINSVLYVASGGGWTSTPPAANSQPVAIVERSNTNNGAVIVKVNGLASSGGNGASDANKLARFSSAGTLPIANIGDLGANVATFLATPTSANLAAAVTGETGTGALVFANSPTLVTPVLGTATGTTLSLGGALPTATVLNSYSSGTSAGNIWRGRITCGGDTARFLMGEINGQAWLGAHNAALNAWEDFYINPDGGKKVGIGDVGGGAGNIAVPLLTVDNTSLNVGIGTGNSAINTRAILELSSTTRGFLPPRMTTAQRDAISSPPAGLMIYNSSTNKLNFYNGSAWEVVTSA